MFNFTKLEKKYMTDAAFNKMVRVFEQLLKEHGFLPSEIREGLFFAQYRFEANAAERVIRTDEEWRQLAEARELMKIKFAGIKESPTPEGERENKITMPKEAK